MNIKKVGLLLLPLCLLAAGCSKGGGEESPPAETTSPSAPAPVVVEVAPGADSLFTVCWDPAAGFDPYTCSSGYNRLLLPLLYEGLFVLDGNFQAQPQLCESYSVSQDGLTWTFQLRAGLEFSDGSPLGAEDVAAAYAVAETSPAYSGRFSDIAAVQALGQDRVIITLTAPNGRLPCLLDIPVVKAGTAGESLPIGSGPYSLVSDGETRLAANSRHRDFEKLPLSEIRLMDGESETLSTDFEQGILDLFVTDLKSSPTLSFRGVHEVRHSCTADLYYLGFNTATGRIFESREAREDINWAVDRGQLLQEVFGGSLTASSLPFHPVMALYDQSLAADYDLRDADLEGRFRERLLSDYDGDGLLEYYSGGEIQDFSVDFIVCTEDSYKLAAARSIAKKLSAAGYPINLRELEREDFVTALEQGNFDLYLAETVLSADFDLRPLLGSGGSLNYGGVADETLDSLIAAFRASGPEAEGQAASDLLRHVAENAYILPLGFMERTLYSHQGVIRGLAPASNNVFYGIADWTVLLTAE